MSDRRMVNLLIDWFRRHARDLPWRKTRDPYAIWVSEIMLQQTQVRTVIPYWNRWMRALPDLAALARARPERLHKLWEGLGYYTRVRNMQRAARIIRERHNGEFPSRFEEVLELPGIGRYTAGAICSIAYNQPTPILDGNVIRVLARFFCVAGDPHDKAVNTRLWGISERLVECAGLHGAKACGTKHRNEQEPGNPRSRSKFRAASAFNQALMELGALICTPRLPKCEICPLGSQCAAFAQGRVGEFPQARARPTATSREFIAFAVRNGDQFLVRQRPQGVVNAHLWELPNVEVTGSPVDLERAALLALGTCPQALKRLCVIKHSITRYRITLKVFLGTVKARDGTARYAGGKWCETSRLSRLPFASAHKKALGQLCRTIR